MRIGHGYDVHRLVEGRKLIIGGIEIPHAFGLEGHSDADVLVHAVMDALLGAAGLGDIGKHFPDTDKQYSGISSMILLEHVYSFLHKGGYNIVNLDCTIVAQRPKLSPYLEQMKLKMASVLKVDCSQINIKATTEENLGFTGREEGISVHAVCLIE